MRVAACVAATMCACASTASATATIPNDGAPDEECDARGENVVDRVGGRSAWTRARGVDDVL